MKYLDSDVIYLCILGGCTYIHTYTIGLECILHYYTIYLHSINSSNFPTKGEGQFSCHISTSIVGGGGGGRPVSLPHKHQYCRWRRGGKASFLTSQVPVLCIQTGSEEQVQMIRLEPYHFLHYTQI